MIRLVCLLTALLVISTACNRESPARLPTQPSVPAPAPVPGPPGPSIQAITIGEEVKGQYKGGYAEYELIAPRDGTLSVSLSWDPWFNGTLLVLNLHGSRRQPGPPAWSPVSGTLEVKAGQAYRLAVEGGGTDWFYDDAYRLTTEMR
jgi:hypothetical protein